MRVLLAIVVLIGTAGGASAEPNTPPSEEPWAKGVSTETQAAANALYDAGNELFARQAHALAIEKYRAALELWDHPSIRFNLAVTLVRLERFVEAADELDLALRFADRPFSSAERYREALDYKTLLSRQLAVIEVQCERGTILFDGKPWFECPGTNRKRVLAGDHLVVARAPGYLTRSLSLVLVGGSTRTEHVDLVAIDRATVLHYPHPRWIPWTIAGSGAVVTVAGFGMWLFGDRGVERFDTAWARTCPSGCRSEDQPYLTDQHSSAILEKNVGIGVIAGGLAIAATGITLAILNRPIRIVPTVQVLPEGGARIALTWH